MIIDLRSKIHKPEESLLPVQYMHPHINGFAHHVVETIPWEAMKINLITVSRNRVWWTMALAKINEFWTDVEKARAGTFVLPPSSRKTKVEKEDEGCLFKF